MKILVQRFMDDGYGKTHIIEEGSFDESILTEIDGMAMILPFFVNF